MSEAENVNPLSKGKAVAGFGKTNTMMWISVSLVIHVAIIGGTSVPYIRDRWIDPDAAAVRKAAAVVEAARIKAEEKAKASGKPLTPTGNGPGGSSTAPSSQPSKLTPDEQSKAETPVMKRITETAKPGELPKKPDDLGISIDETNKNK